MFIVAMIKLIFRKPGPAAEKEPSESPSEDGDDAAPAASDGDEAGQETDTVYGGPQARGAARGAAAPAGAQAAPESGGV